MRVCAARRAQIVDKMNQTNSLNSHLMYCRLFRSGGLAGLGFLATLLNAAPCNAAMPSTCSESYCTARRRRQDALPSVHGGADVPCLAGTGGVKNADACTCSAGSPHLLYGPSGGVWGVTVTLRRRMKMRYFTCCLDSLTVAESKASNYTSAAVLGRQAYVKSAIQTTCFDTQADEAEKFVINGFYLVCFLFLCCGTGAFCHWKVNYCSALLTPTPAHCDALLTPTPAHCDALLTPTPLPL